MSKRYRVTMTETVTYTRDLTTEQLLEMGVPLRALGKAGDLHAEIVGSWVAEEQVVDALVAAPNDIDIRDRTFRVRAKG